MTKDGGVESWAHFASIINNPCGDHGTENDKPCCVPTQHGHLVQVLLYSTCVPPGTHAILFINEH